MAKWCAIFAGNMYINNLLRRTQYLCAVFEHLIRYNCPCCHIYFSDNIYNVPKLVSKKLGFLLDKYTFEAWVSSRMLTPHEQRAQYTPWQLLRNSVHIIHRGNSSGTACTLYTVATPHEQRTHYTPWQCGRSYLKQLELWMSINTTINTLHARMSARITMINTPNIKSEWWITMIDTLSMTRRSEIYTTV